MPAVSPIIREDVERIVENLKEELWEARGSRWLISGGGGFLGAYFLDLLDYCNREVFDRPCRVVCIENFISGTPARVRHLRDNAFIQIIEGDIVKPLQVTGPFDYILHAASIASPTFYRKHPIETIEANVLGLKNLLDLGRTLDVKGFLYFSTSEVYGDPLPGNIPTPEDYNGNVSCTGPRACYDESKRLGETLAVNYYRQYGLPVKVVRPFNVYGPGLKLEDRRVIPDFCRDALRGKKIAILDDGRSTRSFCYVGDAVTGFLAALLSPHRGEAFNVGSDEQEIDILSLAELIAGLVGGVEVEFVRSSEEDYLTDNPRRRCPDLTKARELLGYQPGVGLKPGLLRMLAWYREVYGEDCT